MPDKILHLFSVSVKATALGLIVLVPGCWLHVYEEYSSYRGPGPCEMCGFGSTLEFFELAIHFGLCALLAGFVVMVFQYSRRLQLCSILLIGVTLAFWHFSIYSYFLENTVRATWRPWIGLACLFWSWSCLRLTRRPAPRKSGINPNEITR